jgi:hypothetical protein
MMEVEMKQTAKFAGDLAPGDRIRIGVTRTEVTVMSVAQRAWGNNAVAYMKPNGKVGRRAFKSRTLFRMMGEPQ